MTDTERVEDFERLRAETLRGALLYLRAEPITPPRPARTPPRFRRRFLGDGWLWRVLRRLVCAFAGHEDMWLTDRMLCCRYCGSVVRT